MQHLIGHSYKELKTLFSYNEGMITAFMEKEIQSFELLFDIQQKLLKNHIGGIFDFYYDFSNSKKIAFQAYIKNVDLFFSANNLILQGHYGAAKIIMRQIFEFLLLGKYSRLTNKERFINRWLEGKQVDIYDEVVKRLKRPSKNEFYAFWKMICHSSHATIFSNQASLDFNENKEETKASYTVLLMLLCCNYHLLTTWCLDKKLVYRSEYYGNNKEQNSILKKDARQEINAIKNTLSPSGNRFIKNYTSKWEYV